MIKQILLITLCIAATQQAALAACGSTNGFTNMGVCQYQADPVCHTWAATGCTQCFTSATTQDATTKQCACPSTGAINAIASSKTCTNADANAVCQDGYYKANDTCTACHFTCKTCTNTAKNNCESCWADGVHDNTAKTCTAPTATPKFIRRNGYVATCPAGYVEATVDTFAVCEQCLYGCATCSATQADRITKCLTCAEGHLLNTTSNRCEAAAASGTGACAAGCKAQKCQTTAANCTECDTGYVFTAAGVCSRNSIELCKTYNATDATLCDACETDAEPSADKKSCKCKSHLKKNITAYKAATTTPTVAAAVFYSQKCDACGVTCAAGSTCTIGTAPAADTCAAGSAAASVSNISVTCTDSALVAANCATCGTDGKCTACLNTTLLATDCTKCAADHVKKTATECVPVGTCKAADCTDGKVCGWNTTTSKVECITAPVETTAAATNGLLLSAISMIAALILA